MGLLALTSGATLKIPQQFQFVFVLGIVLAGCDRHGTGAVDCPVQGQVKVAKDAGASYQFRDDCAADALTCIDPLKFAETGNGVVFCKSKTE